MRYNTSTYILSILLAVLVTVAACTEHRPLPAEQTTAGEADSVASTADGTVSTAPSEPRSTAAKQKAGDGRRMSDTGRRTVSKFFANTSSDTLAVGNASLAVPAGSMSHGTVFSITPLRKDELPPLPAGMVNVTGGSNDFMASTDTISGYRFLPHGNHFVHHPASITVPYDSTLIPRGYTAADIHTYYYDEQRHQWTMLKHRSTDQLLATVTVETSHFTDVINGIIKVPESPETQTYVPTSITDLKAADPMVGIQQIEAPTANQKGSATLSFPFDTPEGRGDISASAGLQYSSDGGSSFAGYGWSLPIQSIDIETRWGVPRFSTDYESESYLLMGQQLSDRHYRTADNLPREKDKLFHPMVEDGFSKIIRRGDSPKNYYWEVTTKDGTLYSYGGSDGTVSDEATLTDDKGNRIRWALQRITDTHGNFAAFHYVKSGNNLYPKRYTWTGHGMEEGLHSIDFDIDLTAADRQDIISSGRLGVMQTDRALLRSVTVCNDGKTLRSYTMSYDEGSFGKTLLQSISQLDSKGNTIATQTFDYYDDVKEGIFSDEETVYTAGNDDLGNLVKTKIGHFDETLSLLGGASSKGNTVGGGVMVGAGWGPATVNAGASYSHTKSSNEGRIALIDINGDGMPDKVWKGRDGRLHYRQNMNADLVSPVFGEERIIEGVKSFSSGTTTSNSRNANVAVGLGPASAGYAIDKTTDQSKTRTYFQDFNGDGLVDIAVNGTVFFNHSDGRDVWFMPTSTATGNPVLSSATTEVDEAFTYDYAAIRDSLEREHPLHDIVRLWRAPYAGTITIAGNVEKVSAEGDGVSLSIQHNSDILWQDTLLQHGTVIVPTLSHTVTPGDYITFRVGARYSGTGDEVAWDPRITYTSIAVGSYAGEDLTSYQSSEDYLTGEFSTAVIAVGKRNRFDGSFRKQPTSDDIVLEVVLTDHEGNQTLGDSLLLGADSATTEGTFDGVLPSDVTEGTTVDFRMRSHSPIDWKKIEWSPVFHSDTTSYRLSPRRMMFSKNIVAAPDTIVNAAVASADSTWGTDLLLLPELHVTREADEDTAPATAYMTIKSDDGELLYRKDLVVGTDNSLYTDTIRITDINAVAKSLAQKLTEGRVQVTFSLFNELKGASAQLHILRDSLYKEMTADSSYINKVKAVELSSVNASVYSGYNRFDLGTLYRGWGMFAWNGNDRFGAMPKELMRAPETNDYYDGQRINEEAVERGDMDVNNQMFFTMAWQQEYSRYASATDMAYLDAAMMRPSRLGEDDIVVDTVSYNLRGDGLAAPVLVTETKSKGKTHNLGISMGASIGVNKSHSEQQSYNTVAAMDLNGDGYPDWLRDQDGRVTAQITLPTGALGTGSLLYDVDNVLTRGEADNVGGEIGLSSNKDAYSFKNFKEQYKEAKAAFAQGCSTKELAKRTNQNNVNSDHSGKVAEFACAASGNFSSGYSKTVRGWEDLNGDGLPDMVTEGRVRYGLGYDFAPQSASHLLMLESSKSNNFGDGLGLCVPVLGMFSINAGQNDTESLSATQSMLSDVNGDALPDLIYTDSEGRLLVTLNTGDGFSQTRPLAGKAGLSENLGSSVAVYASVAFTYTIPLPFGFRINITPSIQGSHSESISRTTASLMDIDGDGLPDLVYSDSENRLLVRRNLTGRTNMLKSVTLPLGGHVNISYEQTTPSYDHPGRKWVMSSVETTGGYEENGATRSKQTFEYSGGYRDRRERDFYGFHTVRTNQLDTEDGNKLYRYSVQTYGHNRDYYAYSLVTDESLYDADGRLLQGTAYEYTMRNVNATTDGTTAEAVIFPALTTVVQNIYDENSGEKMTTRVENDYDQYGNLTTYREYAANTELDASIEYHELRDRHIVSVPKHITVCSNGTTYRERSTEVNSYGDITRIALQNETSLPHGEGRGGSLYDITYDTYGNITRLTKPENHQGQRMWHAYTYDDHYHSLVTRVEDAYGYSSATEYDGLWLTPSVTTDLNGQRMEYIYDAVGRPATIRAPYEIESGQPFTIKYEYLPEDKKAHTIHYTVDGNIDTYTFADSLGRAVQTKNTGVVWQNGANKTVSIVSGRTVSDAFGRAVAAFYPTTEDISNIGKYNRGTGESQSTTEYDTHDRTVSVTLADGATTTSAYTIGSHLGEQMLTTTVTDALGRHAESYTDEKGRNRETVQHAGGEDIIVTYDYDPIGQVTTVTHPNGHQTTYTYDMLGRKLSVNHPDAGETIMTYDPAGNLTSKLTAALKKSISDKGCITYTYDYERLKEVLYPENLFNRVTYTYGEAGDEFGRAGRLALVEDASGGEAYYYGRMGEVTKTVRTVMASVADIRTYVYGAEYDGWNRVRTMTYPDGEVVTYHYNAAGQVESLTSNKQGAETTIVEQIGYDKDGHTVYTKLGNGTETEYTYDDARQRLQEMSLTSNGNDIMHNKYAYDAVDNILSISNAVIPQTINRAKLGGASSHTYQYDELNRLIHANGKAKSASYDMAMTFGKMSEPLTKVQKVDSTTTAQSYHNYYKYEDEGHPTAPTQIGHDHYTYDANGNPTRVENDSTAAVREMYWDEDNRLMVLSDNGKTSRYTYNAAGERVIKSHGTMEGVYINGAPQGITFHETDEYTLYPASILTVNKNRFTKHYFIGDKRIASRIGSGSFNNVYGRDNSYVTAGQQDYAERLNQIQSQKEAYYKELGIAPGVPTMKGAYGDPENTGVGYNTIITELGDHSVPETWAQYVNLERKNETPGAPIAWDDPVSPDNPEAGYGFIADNNGETEETFYYHSDHLGSTAYITDKDGNITQYDAYLPYGELLVDEHSSSEEIPYKFNGKELDEETGLYYYVARYMNPVANIWYGVDPLTEKYASVSGYTYCLGNPVKLVDPDGNVVIPVHGTWSNPDTWTNMHGILKATKKLFNDNKEGLKFSWSGKNFRSSRTIAAKQLISEVRKQRKKGEPITLVGHSHGGNVIIEAVNMMVKMKEFNGVQINILTINTPVRDDYQLSKAAQQRVKHVNVYDPKDPVQVSGGNSNEPEKYTWYHKPSIADIIIGEIGPAGRRFKNAQNIEVDNPQPAIIWRGLKTHTGDFHNSHNRVDDWINKTGKENSK